jgi:hypothetical protein
VGDAHDAERALSRCPASLRCWPVDGDFDSDFETDAPGARARPAAPTAAGIVSPRSSDDSNHTEQ